MAGESVAGGMEVVEGRPPPAPALLAWVDIGLGL